MFRRLLVANRGEIARRIIRAAHSLGVEAVAVYSEADRDAPFVREADRSSCIGPPQAARSYLDADAIIQAAIQTEAQAIHPGYGFLSENAIFAQRVMEQRIAWIGPPPRVIRLMGEKASAKVAANAAGLPVIPGSNGLVSSVREALEVAETVGWPVLLKADAGGGGRGMRRADDRGSLESAFLAASAEARAAFGSGALYVEKLLGSARHIEFQVLVDKYGNAIHLFERECSVQRRHQKLLEEAPSSILEDARRRSMGQLVANAIAKLGYVGAGTVELLLERETNQLFFIEMNTRLQVEHPVTEMITGIDLAAAQIRIAAGERLWIQQRDVRIDGHAIELRLCAEDPEDGFKPTPGVVTTFEVPSGTRGEGKVRVDSAVESGSRIPPYYDSLIAKLIAWAPTRDGAIETARAALADARIEGVSTTAILHKAILGAHDFRAGDLTIGVIPGWT
ncbi:MAG: acetyl-CoA carboxylase biotin carboxylase subunit [Deltaproteobacteria bacterium]|nr:acetyl-CoA carboxylase biotin carboxylase subunit [Deltaproteobacteria bacterium]